MKNTVLISLLATSVSILASPVLAIDYSIDTNFTGTQFNNTAQKLYPPNANVAAAQENYLVEFINGNARIYNKQGTELKRQSLEGFFLSNGLTIDKAFTPLKRMFGAKRLDPFDPSIVYNPTINRFVGIANLGLNGQGRDTIAVAVSKSDNPLDGFNTGVIDLGFFQGSGDLPRLGCSASGCTIATVNLRDRSTDIATISNLDLLAGNLSKSSFKVNDPQRGDSQLTPVQSSESPNNYLLANQSFGTSNIIGLVLSEVLPDNTLTSSFIDLPDYAAGRSPIQKGSNIRLFNIGGTLNSNAIYLVNNQIWGVQSVGIGEDNINSLRWFALDPTENSLIDSGIISLADVDLTYPSLAINNQGGIVIGAQCSGVNLYVSTCAVVGQTLNGITSFGTPFVLKEGSAVNAQTQTGGANSAARLGDNTFLSVDPSDPNSFWFSGEYYPSYNNWAINIAKITIPPNQSNNILSPVVEELVPPVVEDILSPTLIDLGSPLIIGPQAPNVAVPESSNLWGLGLIGLGLFLKKKNSLGALDIT